MGMLEAQVTQKSNPMVHRLSFASISQGPGESVQQFVVRLRGTGQDCDFTCPICNHDLSDIYIKDQLIKGTANDALQADLLVKACLLKTLEENINHAEAFEAALPDQAQMSGTLKMSALRASTHRREKNPAQPRCPINQMVKPNNLRCSGCGSHKHGIPKTRTRQQTCPAWNQTCKSCGIKGHFSIVCRSKSRNRFTEVRSLQDDKANMDSLVSHVEFDQETGSYISSNKNNVVEIEVTLVPFSPRPDPRNPEDISGNQSTRLKIFPDSGATTCLGGPKHLYCMGLKESNLIPSKKVIRAVGGSTLISQGWLPVQFSVGEMSTKQALYICNNIDKLYFSKAAYIDVGILSPHFPTPMSLTNQRQVNCVTDDHTTAVSLPNMKQKQSTNVQLPFRPKEPLFPANKENVENLKKVVPVTIC